MVPGWRRLLPGRGRGQPGPRDPAATGTTTAAAAAAGAGFHAAAPAPPAPSPGGGKDAAPQEPWLPLPRVQVRRPGLAPAVEGRRPVSRATQVPSIRAEAAQRCPQVRRPEWRRSLGRLFGIPAWVARSGAAPRDRRRGPLGKGGDAALLPGLPRSRVLPAFGARTPAAALGATSFRSTTRLPLV